MERAFGRIGADVRDFGFMLGYVRIRSLVLERGVVAP